MFRDALTRLSDSQALNGAGTVVSTNTIDLGNPTVKNRVGSGTPLVLAFTVMVAADAADGDETYTFEAISSAAANLGTPTIIAQLAIARALLVAGYKFAIEIPSDRPQLRYVGAQYILGGTTPSITISCDVLPRAFVDDFAVYAKGYNN